MRPGKARQARMNKAPSKTEINTREKILSRNELVRRVEEHRARGERIVLANGCFDILHVGHLRYLQGARREGDVLVVAINSDESMRPLKGEGRPILPAGDRAQLVASLSVVSYVTVFDEPDVTALLAALRPNVHAKGTDYTVETVPERDTARQLGVQIAIVGDPKEHSTRDLLTRLRGLPHA